MGKTKLLIGPLAGGGLVLGYRCSARCRHCLYACGPHREDGLGSGGARLDDVLDALARRAPRASYHIGGGEPFLDLGLLERAVAGMEQRGLRLDYVETNASWVRDEDQAEAVLERLAGAGLGCVLVSLSPFHAERVPPRRTLALIEAARRVLPGGAFVWIEPFLEDLRHAAPSERLDLDELLERRGDAYAVGLARRYGLVPAGRAGRYLHRHGQRIPWREATRAADCRRRLRDTSHFHVDLDGLYVPGLCAGIALPLEQVPGSVDLERFPLLGRLVGGGLGALVELAAGLGFEPLPTYGSACDLCGHARTFLAGRGDYPELGPAGFYDPRSLSFE